LRGGGTMTQFISPTKVQQSSVTRYMDFEDDQNEP